jgi:putative heme-binding domain-containing protein
MSSNLTRLILISCTVLAAHSTSKAAENWADPKLPVTKGLEVWLDASTQDAARKAGNLPPILSGQPVPLWLDGSGNHRDLAQKVGSSQPTFHSQDGYSSLRFSGDRFLSLARLNRSYKEITIFVVAIPFANPGEFSAFLALNQTNKNDYVSGLTIDQGPGHSARFQTLNIEGAGFGGAVNLMKEGVDFGAMQRLCITSTIGASGTKLHFNGKLAGQRHRDESRLWMDQLTVGARFYNNGGPANTRGFLEGDISEVLIYDRVLSDDERQQVEKYLVSKYGESRKIAIPQRSAAGKPLVTVSQVPPVQMFVPGFTVHELPLDLTNINNLLYRPDGKLVALAYDGNIYLLSDTDGDGLEDKAELFWDNKGSLRSPIGMALTPPNYEHGDGVFVASKGKCSLIVDTKRTGKADKEIVIATGWQEIPHGVDALGVAFNPRDHSIYFGLGTASYANGYLLDKSGKSQYKLDSERGTIMRISPDFKRREIVATGIRFPVGVRFNSAGDLFCTDQEGATWLPNGNPLDELLHIHISNQQRRHYGFPPRHPQHLPNVIDEPSVFDYGPQHQSTCGLNFNEPVNGGPVFGPSWWQSDVFVAGYSRGKLYRTKLVKSTGRYVAQNQLIASLSKLAADACVSPKGELVVAVHSGGPDWGSGPSGKGTLYKIRYAGKDLPQPVLIWPHDAREVRVAFDRELEPSQVQNLSGKIALEYGKYVSAGDRFEVQRPGYQTVQDQLRSPRFDLPIYSVSLTADRRNLVLSTAPHPEASHYALTIPGLGRPTTSDVKKKELPQVSETDLHYDLSGVEASWYSTTGIDHWTGWLPHLDVTVSKQLTRGSSAHDEFWSMTEQPGKLTLRTQLNLWKMLNPAVQPGSKLDYQPASEEVTISLSSSANFEVKSGGKVSPIVIDNDGRKVIRVVGQATEDKPLLPIEITLTSKLRPDLKIAFHTNEDARPRPLQLHRFLVPWAALKRDSTTVVDREIPELKGGNWERGRRVFFSEEGTCHKCHTFNGQGEKIGPDLSNLPHRDYASVLRDIADPSFAINPDYITHVISLNDGRLLAGTVRNVGNKLLVSDNEGKITTITKDEIEKIQPSTRSIMPDDLAKKLGPEKMKDLLVFLLSDPPQMPDYGKDKPPAPREIKEVQAILAGSAEPPAKCRPLHIALIAGKKDHGPGEHDYPAWMKTWSKLLPMADGVKVTTALDWPSADDLKSADVLVFYQQGKWTAERAKDIDAYLSRGGGLVYIHYAVDGGADAPGFAQRIGLAWRGGESKFRHGPLDLGFETGKRHPIARNFDKVHFHDESYWKLVGDTKQINLLASGVEDGQAQPLFWTLEPSKGRVFVSIPGHYMWTFDDPLFRVLLLRGIAWTAKEPVDRLNSLVTPGARITK